MKIYFMIMIILCMVGATSKPDQSCFYWVAAGLFGVARAICELC